MTTIAYPLLQEEIAAFIPRLSESCYDGVVIVNDGHEVLFVSDKLLNRIERRPKALPVDYFEFFFGLDLTKPGDLQEAAKIPLYSAFNVSREKGSFSSNRPYPLIETPDGLSFYIETRVNNIGEGKYIAMELWSYGGPKTLQNLFVLCL